MEMFIRARRFGSLPSLSLRSLRSLPSSGGGTLQTEETKRDWRERPEGTGPKGTAGNEGKGKDWRERSDRRDAKRETIRLVPYGRCIVYIPGVSTPISDFQRLHFSFFLCLFYYHGQHFYYVIPFTFLHILASLPFTLFSFYSFPGRSLRAGPSKEKERDWMSWNWRDWKARRDRTERTQRNRLNKEKQILHKSWPWRH